MKTIESILEKHDVVCSCYLCGKSIEQPEKQFDMYGEIVCQSCWDYEMYQAAGWRWYVVLQLHTNGRGYE